MSRVLERTEDVRLAPVLRWPTEHSRNWLARLLDEAESDENILAIVAIGSSVRPNVSSADLDIVVLVGETTKFKAKPPMEVDLRAFNIGEIGAQISKGNDLLGWTAMFGKCLFQRNRNWQQILETWRDRVPLPSADVALERSRNALQRFRDLLDAGDRDAAREQAVSYLTHLARASLIKKGVYPASRPELPGALIKVGCYGLAERLEKLVGTGRIGTKQLAKLVEHA